MHLLHKWEYFIDKHDCSITRSKQCSVCHKTKLLSWVVFHNFSPWSRWDFSWYQFGRRIGDGVGQKRHCLDCNFEETREIS